jgi:hypothetical protein
MMMPPKSTAVHPLVILLLLLVPCSTLQCVPCTEYTACAATWCPAGTQVLDLEAEQKFSKGAVTIKGFATIDNVCLINIEGTGMVGVPGAQSP